MVPSARVRASASEEASTTSAAPSERRVRASVSRTNGLATTTMAVNRGARTDCGPGAVLPCRSTSAVTGSPDQVRWYSAVLSVIGLPGPDL